MKEEVVATIGNNALVLDTPEEKSLGSEASLIERQVSAITIDSEFAYSAAGELLKQVKGIQKKVKEYWEPLRVSAKSAYDAVNSKKKQMLDPINNAESILKTKMGKYTLEQERIARELEEQKRREAQEAINQKLDEAAALEESGDDYGADFALAEAEVYDAYAQSVTVQPVKPKVDGISTSKSWRIEVVDPDLVPVSINGFVLRPVSESEVKKLVKTFKGQIEIPGVKIEEEVVMSVRA